VNTVIVAMRCDFCQRRDFASQPWLSADYVQNQRSGASLTPILTLQNGGIQCQGLNRQ